MDFSNSTFYSPQSGVLHIVHNAPQRNSIKTEHERKRLATELIDAYKGNQESYLRSLIYDRYKNPTIAESRAKYLAPLPILKKLIKNISKIYDRTPIRKFYLDGKEIVKELSDLMDADKYVVNLELLEILEKNFYNNKNATALKMAEEYTNLLGDTIWKVKTDNDGNLKLIFLPNDIVSVFSHGVDSKEFKNSSQESSIADIICIYEDELSKNAAFYTKPTEVERWTVNKKTVYGSKKPSDNEASKEAIKYFDPKNSEKEFKGYIGDAFAPFVVFRSEHSWGSFWNTKDTDVLKFINELNLKLSHKNYLTQTDTDNTKILIDGTMNEKALSDPSVINTIKSTTSKRTDPKPENQAKLQELKTADLKNLDEAIMQDMKTLFKMYDLPFDSLLATKNVMSAENKQVENEALFSYVNSQMDIWAENEKNLFKTMIAVYNRDNQELPKGLSMTVNFEKREVRQKTIEEIAFELHNNLTNTINLIMERNPDLSKDEAQKMYESNIAANDKETSSLFEDEDFEKDSFGDEQDQKIKTI